MGTKERPYTSFKWMHRQYIVKRLTETEIAALANTTQGTINRWLRYHQLTRKK